MTAQPIQKIRLLVSLILSLTLPGRTQMTTATVLGVVQDSSKSSIPDAKLKLINVQTGSENDSTTNGEGSFLLAGVIPGAYSLRIERAGFATTQLTGLLLNVGDTRTLLISLKVGSVAESVIVDASGLTLNTTDASVSTVVDRKFVANVPLNGRSFQDLISMTPGIVTQSPQAAGQGSSAQGDFSVNGQLPQANEFFVDGISANINSGLTSGNARIAGTGSAAGSTALGTTHSLVSIDALQEFRVLSSTYSAEYGRTPGGQFTFLTRSGTNALHGSVYDYFRHYDLDALDFFSGFRYGDLTGFVNGTPYNQDDFGGALGGPVLLPHVIGTRDKTFFFFSYEGLYLTQPTPQAFQYTPAFDLRHEVPAALVPVLDTFPDYGSSEIINAAGQPTGLALNLLPPFKLPAAVNSTSLRLDHTFSPNLSAFFRYGGTPSHEQIKQLSSLTSDQVNTQTFTLGATTQVTGTASNEFRLGFARNTTDTNTITDPNNYPPTSLDPAIGLTGFDVSQAARVYIHILGVGDSASYTDQATGTLHQWNLRDAFSLQSGNHLMKLGIDQRRIASHVIPPALSVQAYFFDRASMVTNLASGILVTQSTPASPIVNQFSAFMQDEWQVAKPLTLSLGLRWEVNPPPKGEHGADAYTVLGDVASPATLHLAPRGTPLWNTSWYNFAPRLGLAWLADPRPDRQLVVRAGGGIFFDTGTQPALRAFNGIGFTASTFSANVPLPVTSSQLDVSAVVAPPYSNTSAFAFPPHLQLPYSIQWDIGVDKSLGKNQAMTLSYVGAGGHRLLQEQRRNVSQVNSDFGDVSYFPLGMTSSYQAFQAKFQRSLAHGVEALSSYTFAHSFDFGSTDPAYSLVYGTSDLDVRHNLEGAVSWDLPKPTRGGFLRKLVGTWAVDGRLIARTGFPVNLSGNFSLDPVTGNTFYSGVNLNPGRPLYLHGSQYPGNRAFNGGQNTDNPAFSLPDGTGAGNAPRNLVRGFSLVQTNIAARRDFHLRDGLNVQVEAETFNLLNHPNFGYIDPYLSDALFGQATKMLNQSFGGTGALYQQGGPRSNQFSIKLIF